MTNTGSYWWLVQNYSFIVNAAITAFYQNSKAFGRVQLNNEVQVAVDKPDGPGFNAIDRMFVQSSSNFF